MSTSFSNLRKFAVFLLLAATPFAQAADMDRVRAVGENFICICGCTQILSRCNHLGCASSQPMMKELAAMLDSGQSEDQIIANYTEKYGYTVLSTPPASGFNLLIYILPFAALLGGAMIAVYVARSWRAKMIAQEPRVEMASNPTLNKVEEELRTFTPED